MHSVTSHLCRVKVNKYSGTTDKRLQYMTRYMKVKRELCYTCVSARKSKPHNSLQLGVSDFPHLCAEGSPSQLEVFRTCECSSAQFTSLWNRSPSVAAGLSVVSLLHVGRFVQQPRPNRLVHRHLEGHLFEHLTHRHLQQTRG